MRLLTFFRRTYGGKEGEEIREGFEPTDSPPVIDPKEGEDENDHTNNSDKFVLDEEDTTSPGAEERNEWGENRFSPKLKPKYGVSGEEGFENVWEEAAESHTKAKENP